MKSLMVSVCVAALASAFNSESCEVVTVMTENGAVRINKSDYDADPSAFTLADEQPAPETLNTAAVQMTGTEPTVPLAASAPDGATASGQPVVTPNTPAPVPPVDNTDAKAALRAVTKSGKKFFVVDGNAVTVDGFEADGYATEKAAWDAILAAAPPAA